MSKNAESGHAKCGANLESLISVINGFGAAYNPSKPSLSLSNLNALSQNVNNALNLVNSASGRYTIAIAARTVAFKPLSKLATRILNAIRASDTTQQIDDAAQSLVRKLQGKRATPKLTTEQKASLKAEGIVKKEVSSSQMGFDNRLDGFDKLIQLLSPLSQYAPNEAELQLATLINYYNTLKALNAEAVSAETQLKNARLSRNDIFYKPETGLVDIATAVKKYIKSLFGATSQQSKQISGLTFKVPTANKMINEEFITDQVPVV
jgi:hypothetical protein